MEGLYDRGFIIKYPEGDIAFYRTPLIYKGAVNDRYHVIVDGESLLSIAQKYYGDQYSWFIIADVNSALILDIFDLPVGITLLIPDLTVISSLYGQS